MQSRFTKVFSGPRLHRKITKTGVNGLDRIAVYLLGYVHPIDNE